MSKAVKVGTDMSIEEFDLQPYPHLGEVLGGYFELVSLNGLIGMHRKHIGVGIAIDEDGHAKRLPVNKLATALRGVFHIPFEYPIVGPVVLVGSNWEGEVADLPEWPLILVRTIKECCDKAFEFVPDVENN